MLRRPHGRDRLIPRPATPAGRLAGTLHEPGPGLHHTPCPVSAPFIGTAIARLAGTSSGRRCDGLRRPGYRRKLRQRTGRDPMIDAQPRIRDLRRPLAGASPSRSGTGIA